MPDDRASPRHCPEETLGLEDGDCPCHRVPVHSVLTAKVRQPGQLRPRLPLTSENTSSQVSGNFQVSPGLAGQETTPSRRFAQAYIDILWEHGDYRFAQAYQRLIIAA